MALATMPEAEEEVSSLEFLEEEFNKPLVCFVDGNQAFGVTVHGPCRVNICAEHYRATKDFLAQALISAEHLECRICNTHGISPTEVTVTKI